MTNFARPILLAVGLALLTGGCSVNSAQQQRGAIKIDGSSTVYPITESIAQAYTKTQANPVEVSVGFSGTGGGFNKFCRGETDISNASRPISEAEMATCDVEGIRFYELPVAFDALTVVVNKQNTWAQDITLEELKSLWQSSAQGQVTRWNQVRSSWPNQPITLFGPGSDSGTYDYFSEVVVSGDPRSDFIASEDDEILAKGVGQEKNALGYFGLAWYDEFQDSLTALAIDSGNGAVAPSPDTVASAQYQPLSRPLFIYVNFKSAQANPAVREFVRFYLENAANIVDSIGYVPLTEEGYHIAWVNYQEGETGTAFDGKPQPNLTVAELLRKTKRF